MTNFYPVIDRRQLGEADKAGWLRRRARAEADLLRPDAHQVLVYRVDGQYVMDNDRMRGADERVVNATHVSVVDTRRNAPVTVTFDIHSADTATFEVAVTFVCTVTDPVAVVRGGVNAREALWGYLQAHPRTFELGLDYRLAQINELRRAVSAQITAYATIKPPTVTGMQVSMASITVKNPEYLEEYEEQHRGKDVEGRLALQDQENEHRLRTGQQLGDHSLESAKQVHEHHVADRDQTHVQEAAVASARHRQKLQGEQTDFELDEFGRRIQVMGTDPRSALMTAFVSRQIDAATLSERMQALDARDAEVRERRESLEGQDRRELAAAAREQQAANREAAREVWHANREDRLGRERSVREDERVRFQAQIELIKQAANNGHLDMIDLHADRLYSQVFGLPQTAVEHRPTAQLPSQEEAASVARDDAASQVSEDDD